MSRSEFISNETLKKPDKTILRKRDRHFNYREKKMTIICVCNVIAFLITWLPLVGYGFSEMIGRTIPDVWFVRLGFSLALINSILNPCIYFLVRRDFRSLFQDFVTETLSNFKLS